MDHQQPRNLHDRVTQAADAVLEREGAIGPIELLKELRFLEPCHVDEWRKGNEYYQALEPHIQCGPKKLQAAYEVFFQWVQRKKLEPFEAPYAGVTRHGAHPLGVTADGDPEQERFFRTHFRPANIAPAKLERIEKKLSQAPDLVVYELTSDSSQCSECQTTLERGELLFLERRQPLCLVCADMDHLEFLPRGDAALTRRAKKHSPLWAVVVRFSRARKRYERQGLLVTSDAITLAGQECVKDEEERARRRKQDQVRRGKEDQSLVDKMAEVIVTEFPGCPAEEARAIAQHTAQRGSGRVGRSAAGRQLDPNAITLAVAAWIRHQHTPYDELLMKGVDRQEARQMVGQRQERVLELWAGQDKD